MVAEQKGCVAGVVSEASADNYEIETFVLATSLSHLNGSKAADQCPCCSHARILVGGQLCFLYLGISVL